MTTKTALITGVGGQDGTLLAKLLLEKGYEVWGTSRDAQGSGFANLHRLGIADRVRCLTLVPEDFRSVLVALRRSQPDEIYHLAGQSSVGLSFEQPAETIQSITMGMLNVLEAARMLDKEARIYQAGSSESFGDTQGLAADETTPFRPRSPYAVAKASVFWLLDNYREAYQLHACSGILFNHESPLRPERFVTQKIVSAARRIAAGSVETLRLGRLDIARDWGWASEYVEAMWLMLQQDQPQDFVVATGCSFTLEEFVAAAFDAFSLDWRRHVVQDEKLFRPTDIRVSRANPAKAKAVLGWEAATSGVEVVRRMLADTAP